MFCNEKLRWVNELMFSERLATKRKVIFFLPLQADGLNFAKEMLLSTAESATYSASEVERRLHSNLRNGLSWQEALSRSKIIGYNELLAPQEDSTFKKYVEQFKNPLILLLLGKHSHLFNCFVFCLTWV